MKFSLSWLSEHIDFIPGVTPEIISSSLTNLGLEVESILDPSEKLKDFKIAKIINIAPHPNADKLNICKVETGIEQLSVVCGATNVKDNLDKLVYARVTYLASESELIGKWVEEDLITGDIKEFSKEPKII